MAFEDGFYTDKDTTLGQSKYVTHVQEQKSLKEKSLRNQAQNKRPINPILTYVSICAAPQAHNRFRARDIT